MGRTSDGDDADETRPLFEHLPESRRPKSRITRVEAPIWTENKARLIAAYLRRFTFVTRHGAYIDGFAGPQSRDHTEADAALGVCAAKLVLETKPALLRNFWLCDLNKDAIVALEKIRLEAPEVRGRHVEILHGDFNKLVERILDSGVITETMATFCLLDQRTFECHWSTIEKLAHHKQSGHKIELFYFLGTSWMDRALGGMKHLDKISRWWGREDWTTLFSMEGRARADAFAARFADELGYAYVQSWPIRERGNGGRLMYHMIHCSDHERAPKLMEDAYREVARPYMPEQISMDEVWGPVTPRIATRMEGSRAV